MSEPLSFVLFLLAPLVSGALLRLFYRSGRARGNRDSWRRLIAGNLLVFLFLLSLLFVAGETYYRFICDASDAVNFTKVSARWFQRYWVRNAIGFRDNIEYSREIEPGRRRVSFVGDSFTAGHGIKSVEDRFANRIRAAHPEWEVHALAILGADTDGEIELLAKSLKDGYQLDEVVLVYCLNDVADLLPEWNDMMKAVRTDLRSKNWFVQNSYLVNTLYYHWKSAHDPQLRDYFRFVREGYQGEMWERQKRRLTTFRDLVQSHGGRLSVVTFPLLHTLAKPDNTFQLAHDELDRFWKESSVPHLDLRSAFSNQPPEKIIVSRHDPHPNEFANALAAEQIEAFLRRQMALPPPAAPGQP
jgi:hypothetical protein